MITYRTMTPHDIAGGLSLCRAAGWNQLARDWEIFLRLGPADCRVATQLDKIIGTVTTIRYQDFFSWIGMVLVDPGNQRQGIGMKLLQEALEILRNEETVKLDATPAGREVYLKLNFVDEYRISRMSAIVPAEKLNLSTARSLRKSDLPTLAEMDHEAFGANRQTLLKWILEGAPQYAFILEATNEIQGYCFGRHGYNFTHIGPVFAKNAAVAKNVVSAALHNCIGHPVILDVLHLDVEFNEWLASLGFVEQRPLIRMYKGTNRFPGSPKLQYAILGPEFG